MPKLEDGLRVDWIWSFGHHLKFGWYAIFGYNSYHMDLIFYYEHPNWIH